MEKVPRKKPLLMRPCGRARGESSIPPRCGDLSEKEQPTPSFPLPGQGALHWTIAKKTPGTFESATISRLPGISSIWTRYQSRRLGLGAVLQSPRFPVFLALVPSYHWPYRIWFQPRPIQLSSSRV